ncbi:MAG: hypothetical protein KIS85_01415 [Anaerolineales bacterium]|nr:hypothetical protein [Anaerolineales bacterium]
MLFSPPRRRGVLLYGLGVLLCTAVLAVCLSLAVEQPPGLAVIGLVIGGLLAALPLPILLYRLYGLLQSAYWLGRDGLRLQWGLRQLDLPYSAVVDVARADELAAPLALPAGGWSGVLLGRLEDAELGEVEYLAADPRRLVLLGTAEGVYAISPDDPQAFVAAYKRQSERGSLRPLAPRSVMPSFVLAEAWAQQGIRRLLIAGAALALALLVLVGVLAPGSPGVSLGFTPDGQPLPLVAGVQLFLLPVLNLFFYVGNFMLGLLFYREKQGGVLASLLWGASLVTSLLFLAAVLASVVTHVA